MLHMMVFMGLWLAMGVQPSGEGWEGAGGGLCSAGGPRNLTLSGGANATQLLLYGCAEPATWDDAEGWCVERGGHLPSVRLASELAALGAITHFPVRRHDLAGIWVAFFSRCQRHRGGQGTPLSELEPCTLTGRSGCATTWRTTTSAECPLSSESCAIWTGLYEDGGIGQRTWQYTDDPGSTASTRSPFLTVDNWQNSGEDVVKYLPMTRHNDWLVGDSPKGHCHE